MGNAQKGWERTQKPPGAVAHHGGAKDRHVVKSQWRRCACSATRAAHRGFALRAEPTNWTSGQKQESVDVTKCHTPGENFAGSMAAFQWHHPELQSVVEQPADALSAMDRHDGVAKEAGDADDLAGGRQGLEAILDGIGENQLLDGAAGDLSGRATREDAVGNAGIDVLAAAFLAGNGHLDQGPAGDCEIVDDQDVLAPYVADDVEHLGMLIVAAANLVA